MVSIQSAPRSTDGPCAGAKLCSSVLADQGQMHILCVQYLWVHLMFHNRNGTTVKLMEVGCLNHREVHAMRAKSSKPGMFFAPTLCV